MGLPENRVYTAYPQNCNREKDEPMDLGTQVAVFFQTKPQLESFSPLSYWSFVNLLAAFLRFSPLPKHKKVTIPLAQCCGYGLSLRVHPILRWFQPLWKIWLRQLGFSDLPNINRKNNMFQKMQAVLCYKMISTILFPKDWHITYPHKT